MTPPRRVLVLGARGQLGRCVVDALRAGGRWEAIATDRDELDITRDVAVRVALGEIRPAWVANCAGLTSVDACETDRQTDRVNADAVAQLAAACERAGCGLVHFSSDYVFDGTAPPGAPTRRPYHENDPPHPLNAYGRAKLASEQHARTCRRHLIIRTAWLYGPHGRNFVNTILTAARRGEPLRVVHDQTGSPSFAADVAAGLVRLLERDAQGTFHLVNAGQASWYELACAALRLTGLTGVPVTPISSDEYASPARRPAYSVLDTGKYIATTGHVPRPWESALAEFLRKSRA